MKDKNNRLELVFDTEDTVRCKILPLKNENDKYVILESEFIPERYWGEEIEHIEFECPRD